MTHPGIPIETLYAFMDGALPAEEGARVRLAIAADPSLEAQLDRLVAADRALEAWPGVDQAPADFTARVLARVPRRGRLVRLLAPLAVAAALLIGVVLLLRNDAAEPSEIFVEDDYVDYRWEADGDTFGSLAVTDLEQEILAELRSS